MGFFRKKSAAATGNPQAGPRSRAAGAVALRASQLVLLASCACLALAYLYPLFNIQREPEISPEIEGAGLAGMQGVAYPPRETYLQATRRQIFGTQETSLPEIRRESPVSAGDAQTFKEYSLVGVILSKPPQAVIEHAKTQKTYYLTEGEMLGEFLVQKITPGKVILSKKEQRFEMGL